MTGLDGRVAIVTGASTGIGNATARALAAEGASVVLAARSEDKLHTLADEIEDNGGVALVVPTDVTDDEQLQRLVERTAAEFAGIDVLVNNAGIGVWGNEGVVDTDIGVWRREMETNLLGLMSLTHYAAEVMRDGGGDVVNVSSGADRGFAGEWPAYVTSKWGVRGFTGSAQLGLREYDIRVTLLSPGEVATPIQPPQDIQKTRMLDPADVAEAVVFAVTQPRHVSVSELRINPSHVE